MAFNSVSLLGSSITQSGRLKSLNVELQDLQRQLASQKKHETYSGFRTDAFRIQDMHEQTSRLQVYGQNIKRVETRMNMMLDSVEQMRTLGNQIQDSILTQTREGDVNVEDINIVGDMNLSFLYDLMNVKDGDRYLLAGTDSENQPLEDINGLVESMNVEISNWLDGTQTYDQMITNIDNLSNEALGLSTTLSSAGAVTVKVDDNVNIDYSLKADEQGFKDMLKGFALAKALKQPDEAVDIGTKDEFQKLLTYTSNLVGSGVDKAKNSSYRLSSQYNLLKNIKEQNTSDTGMLQGLISDKEDADPTEVVIALQGMQSQLTASYEVTRIMSEMSLVNFL